MHVGDIFFGTVDVLAENWIVDILSAFQPDTWMSLPTEHEMVIVLGSRASSSLTIARLMLDN